ncbi:MAG: hypothetical protein H6568_04305 [Lewinellaceae bacterium]|nr:hypothetical protein [Saprospiraceae bacterium]MCB9311964.1 hypothetical protein [Lewinellaceae bacterium]HRW74720.1 hypothetical protein [Saprospiraceae bacterium]
MNQDQQPQDWRKKLTDQQAPMDVDRFWAQLEPQLPPQRKRRAFWWWMLPVGLLVAGGLFWWSGQQTELADESHVGHGAFIPSHSAITDEQPPVEGSGVSSEIPTTSEVAGSGSADQGSPRRSSSHSLQRSGSGAQLSSGQENDGHLHTVSTMGPESHSHDHVEENNRDNPLETRRQSFPTDEPNGLSETVIPMPARQEIQQVMTLPAVLIGELAYRPPALQEAVIERSLAAPVRSGWEWALVASGGPGMGIRSLQAERVEDADWIADRKRTERLLESWQVRLMGEVVTPQGVYLEAGLQWTRQNERLDWSKDSTSWTWGPATGFLVDDQGGSQPWQDSAAWSSYSLRREVRHYNRISTIEVPIGLGYEHRLGVWSIRAGGGLMINLRQSFSGRSLLPQGWPGYWEQEEDLALRSRIGLGYYGQIRVGRRLLPGLEMFVQPTWSAYPGDRQEGDQFRLKYDHIHLQTGIRWRLSNH